MVGSGYGILCGCVGNQSTLVRAQDGSQDGRQDGCQDGSQDGSQDGCQDGRQDGGESHTQSRYKLPLNKTNKTILTLAL